MAIDTDALKRILQNRDKGEGLITDAEFREEVDLKSMRYTQATAMLLMAIAEQNEIIMKLLAESAGEEWPEG